MYHPERRWRTASPSWQQTRTMLVILAALLGTLTRADDLVQSYCSSENTGSDYGPISSIWQSNGACKKTCSNGVNFALAIVQGQNCWCSNYLPASQASVDQCSAKCVGYPFEFCGNEATGLFGYIQIGAPLGTAEDAVASSSQEPEPSTDVPTSTAQAQTVFNSVTVTNDRTTTISPSVSVLVSVLTNTPTPTPTTTAAPAPATTSSDSTTETPSSTSMSTTSPITALPTPVPSVKVVTISDRPVTQTVTSVPTAATADAGSQPIQQSSNKVSAGLIAGVVIAAVVAVLAVVGLLFFCWRRRKHQQELEAAAGATTMSGGGSNRPTRNTSVLTTTGLIDKVYPSAAGARPRTTSNTNGTDASGVSPMTERRRSQPLFYDQRLNPATLMDFDNGSRVSVNTLPDNRDFSRTLNVTNPDPHTSWQ